MYGVGVLVGADMVGELECSGIGSPMRCDVVHDVNELWASHRASNAALVKKLRVDEHSEWLREHTMAEAEMGRMSRPIVLDEGSLGGWLLHPRFAVSQPKPDGGVKLRAVDHLSWSAQGRGKAASVNGSIAPCEKLRHDTLDSLIDAVQAFARLTGEIPGLYKGDIEGAFRRIPVSADQRWTCGIAFKHGEQVCMAIVYL